MHLSFGQFLGRTSKSLSTSGFSFSEVIDADISEVPRHTHDNDHFLIVLRGSYITEARGASDLCGPAALIFNPAGTTHRDRFQTRGGSFLTISVDALFATHIREEVSLRERAMLFNDAPQNWLATRLARELRDPDETVLESFGTELLVSVANDEELLRGAPDWLRIACDLMEDRFNESIRLSEIAQQVGVHPIHLTRVFRRFMGCTAGEYLRACRIRRASERLRTTTAPLAAIAHETGFPDQSHLTKSFARYTGFTPGAYRRAFGRADV